MSDVRLGLGLQTKLSQKIVITPQMRQSLSILQMPITELSSEISSYVEENPVLEVFDQNNEHKDTENTDGSEYAEQNTEVESSLLKDISSPEWSDYIENGSSNELSFAPVSPEEEEKNYEHYVSASDTLSSHLLFQLRTADLNEKEILVGEEIIGNLSGDGYFRYDLNMIASSTNTSIEICRKVLNIIKTFDPAGIACENLQECIISQLPELGVSEGEILQIKELLYDYASELENYKYAEIEKKTGLEKENLDELIALIRKTDPKPGLKFSQGGNFYILPDVFIVRTETGSFDVLINESGLPALKLNDYYLKALKQLKEGDSAKNYIEDKLKSAIWIIKSLQKRQKAIYSVARALAEAQWEYLLLGEKYLKPLRLKDIADSTGFSESTVSRVTSGKYAMTEHGLIELKSFFSKGMDSQSGDMSTRKIKTLIKGLIDSEPAAMPYSDEKIAGILSDDGVDIARRTVAKYRDELGIPTMSRRKRMRR